MKIRYLVIATLILVLSLGPLQTSATTNVETDDQGQNSQILVNYAIITLNDQPLATYDGHISGYTATKPAPGQKLDLSSPAAQAYSNYLANQRSLLKSWLSSNAPEVQVISEYSTVLNAIAVQLNGHNLKHLQSGYGVSSADNSFTAHIDMNRSPTLIGAPALWNAVGGQANAGAGIKIGIIDTGIDTTHPFLTDNSLVQPAGYPKCDALDSAVGKADTACKYVSNKVLVARMFCTQPVCIAFDAQAKQDHGSHVSGTAAGVANTCAPFVGCTLSGIAPKAFLGNYNVFPGNVTNASSHDIALAVEQAVDDGMDVLNLSLGGTPTAHDPLVDAVNDATDAGVVVAIAAGNAGPFPGTIESPGIAAKVITAGASTNPHFIGIPVTADSLGTFGGALGQFKNYGQVSTTYSTTTSLNPLTGLVDNRGCGTINENLSGKIGLIRRGVCSFTTKVRNAQNAGAIGAIIFNNVAGDPIAMAQDGTKPVPTIPAIMVSNLKGTAMANAATKTVTIDGTSVQEFFTDGPSADIIAGFSSRGPPFIGNRLIDEIKPDVVAPGVNVYSSILMSSCAVSPCFAFFQGTSMATPHVAGSAALLKQQHPDWSPQQIKSALVNTAKRPVGSSSTNSPLPNPMDRGGGRIDLAAASQVTGTIEAHEFTSINFGQIQTGTTQRDFDVQIDSVINTDLTYSISVSLATPGISVTTSNTTLTVPAGGHAQFRTTVTVTLNTATGDYYGDVVLSGGTVTLQVPFWVEIIPGQSWHRVHSTDQVEL